MAVIARGQRTIGAPIGFGAPGPRLLLLPALALGIVLGGAVLLDLAFSGRAIPGVRVAGVEVGTLDAAGIRARLEREVAGPWATSSVRVTHGSRSFTTTNADLAVAPDVDRAVAEALAFGRRGSPLARLDQWLDALSGRAQLGFAMSADGDAARTWVDGIAADIDRPASDGRIERAVLGYALSAPVEGVRADRSRLLAALLEPDTLGDREIAVPFARVLPALDEAGYREAADLVRAVTAPLELTAGERGIVEDPLALARFVTVEKVPAGISAPVVGVIAPERRWRYAAAIDEAAVREWVTLVAAAMDRPAKNASYRVAGDGYAVVPALEGVRIDQTALLALALDELRWPVDGRRVLAAPMTTEQPRFTTYDAERSLGALTTVATFQTFYPLNAARHANIAIGARLLDGTVVAPGDTHSFWSAFGDEPSAHGLVPAGAIVNGISDDSVTGGGLCQVSTTLFNAVLAAGYEIVERHAHSYLIERYPIGLDAAVFFPSSDLRWRNDTGHPVLIRSWVTPTSVSFALVSVPTGRTVTFGPAWQSNWVKVTPALKPDPGHAPGYAVDGRDVVRVRTVSQAGEVVHQDTFWSRYAPVWGGPAAAP